jgi:hypothetical protein
MGRSLKKKKKRRYVTRLIRYKMSFFRQIRHSEGLNKFREVLSKLENPHQHVILCFASSQMRWTFLSCPRRLCPHCGSSWYWDHFYSCSSPVPVLHSRGLSLPKVRSGVMESEWRSVFADIAHVLLIWSFSLNSDPNYVLNYDTEVFRSLVRLCTSWIFIEGVTVVFSCDSKWVTALCHLLSFGKTLGVGSVWWSSCMRW